MINLRADTYMKLKKLAAQNDTFMSEMVRYLVDLADAGKIKIR